MAVLLTSHFETQHNVYPLQVLNMDLTLHDEEEKEVLKVSYSRLSDKYFCPVPGCAGEATTLRNLRRQFMMRHPNELVDIPGEGKYPHCGQCDIQISTMTSRHLRSDGRDIRGKCSMRLLKNPSLLLNHHSPFMEWSWIVWRCSHTWGSRWLMTTTTAGDVEQH